MYDYKAIFIKATDGDSAQIEIDLGLKIYHRTNCRLAGINTPELNDPDPEVRLKAFAARDRLRELLTGQTIIVISHKLDKFGRPLVTILINGLSVNQQMINEGHAQIMMGIPTEGD
jgi:endonuclease YncB( thermonuclease family)